MGSFKQQWLTWIIIISAAAACVSCQGLITSNLREGNRTCPGDEVTFNCTLRGSSILAWISPEYIEDGNPLQLSAQNMLGVDVQSMINGRVTATATLTNTFDDNGVPVLESTLRITAVRASVVTCRGISGDPESIEFSFSAVPGVPQNIRATEISRPRDNLCIILVTWNPPANSDVSDIARYIVYVPSRDIREVSFSTVSTLNVMNCGNDIRIQVAAVNFIGCVGMNSSEVQPDLVGTPSPPTDDGSTTTDGGSSAAPTCSSSQFSAGAITGITFVSTTGVWLAIVVIVALLFVWLRRIWRNKDRHVTPDAGEGDTLELLPKAEESVNYVWELQKRSTLQAKEYYQKQSKHDFGELGTEKDRVSVSIWMDDKLDDSWKAGLCEAVQAINEAAPGLTLSIIEDKKLAFIHVLATDKKEAYTVGDIQMRLTLGRTDYNAKIRLGRWEDDSKEGISTRELFHALGFRQANDLSLTRFDSRSITLYQNKEAYESARIKHPVDSIWWLKEPIKDNTKPSELDKVCLNLVYPPCRDATANNARYRPKLGKTGMYYCGRSVMNDRTYPGDKYIDSFCGPNYGPNCPACRTIKSPKVKEVLKKQKWQGMTGRVYCGIYFTKFTERHDGVCGINNGPACSDCVDLLNKEIV